MRSFRSSELQWRIEGHFGCSGGGDTGAYDMFLGQDYPRLAQASEQRVQPEKNVVHCCVKWEQVSEGQKGNLFCSNTYSMYNQEVQIFTRNSACDLYFYSTFDRNRQKPSLICCCENSRFISMITVNEWMLLSTDAYNDTQSAVRPAYYHRVCTESLCLYEWSVTSWNDKKITLTSINHIWMTCANITNMTKPMSQRDLLWLM